MLGAVEDRRRKVEEERAVENALILQASETSCAIRRRLADVADELRRTAISTGSDNLLQLALKFEKHARAGDIS